MRSRVVIPSDEDLLEILISNGWIREKTDGLGYIYTMRTIKSPWAPTRILKILAPMVGYHFRADKAPNKCTAIRKAFDRITDQFRIEWPDTERGGHRYFPDRVTGVDKMLEELGITDRTPIPLRAMKTLTSRWYRILGRVKDKEASKQRLIAQTRAKFPDAFKPKSDPIKAFNEGLTLCHRIGPGPLELKI